MLNIRDQEIIFRKSVLWFHLDNNINFYYYDITTALSKDNLKNYPSIGI